MKFKDIGLRIQRVKNLNKHERRGLFIILIAVYFVIASFILIPLINSERIWKSGNKSYFLTNPHNHLGNQYEVIVLYSGSHLPTQTGSITFRHLKSGKTYTFYYAFNFWSPGYFTCDNGLGDTLSARKTFEMRSGKYIISISSNLGSLCSYQLFEKGIIPKYSDWIIYLLLISNSIIIILLGYNKYKGGFLRKFSCQICGKPVLLKSQICQKCWEKSFQKNFEEYIEFKK